LKIVLEEMIASGLSKKCHAEFISASKLVIINKKIDPEINSG